MDFTITMTTAGWLLLGGGALVIGIAYQLIGQLVAEVTMPYEWVVTAIVAFLGGLVCGQFVTSWLTIESLSTRTMRASGNRLASSSSSRCEPTPIIVIRLPHRGHSCGTALFPLCFRFVF